MLFNFFYTALILAVPGTVYGLPTERSTYEAALNAKRDLVGRGTIYYQNGAYGSCGVKHADGDYIVALGTAYMKGYKDPHCGRRITATNKNNGKTIQVTVADTCGACGPNDIDFALGPWNALTNHAAPGVFPVSWHFN